MLKMRNIVHLDMDTFFVSVERLLNSGLRGVPVIIGGMSERGVVSSCSYEARCYGVRSGMPLRVARMLCGDGVFIRGDMDLYSKYSRLVTEVVASRAPVFEKASIDEHYVDMTGMERFFGTVLWAHELREEIVRETGLPVSLGLSINKTVSKIAAGEAKPNGELTVERERVNGFMDPLSVSKMPGLGAKTSKRLTSMGVSTIGTLRRMPVEMLTAVFGENGRVLWKKARGCDDAPVQRYWERKSISTERTFETDIADTEYLRRLLVPMVERTAFELRRKQKLAGVVTVKIRYSNFDTHTMQKRIGYTSFDHLILEAARSLFDRIYKRRMSVRLLGVKLSGLIGGVQQLDMFEDSEEMVNLYKAMDDIRLRYGVRAVRRGVD